MRRTFFDDPEKELLNLQGAHIEVFDIKNFRNLEEHIGRLGDMPDKLNVLVVIGDIRVLDKLGGELDVKRRGLVMEGATVDIVLDAVYGTRVKQCSQIAIDLGRLSGRNIAIDDDVLGIIDRLEIRRFSGTRHQQRPNIGGEDRTLDL